MKNGLNAQKLAGLRPTAEDQLLHHSFTSINGRVDSNHVIELTEGMFTMFYLKFMRLSLYPRCNF